MNSSIISNETTAIALNQDHDGNPGVWVAYHDILTTSAEEKEDGDDFTDDTAVFLDELSAHRYANLQVGFRVDFIRHGESIERARKRNSEGATTYGLASA